VCWVCGLGGGGGAGAGAGGRDTIEGPTEGRFSTIFGNRKVIFSQNAGGVWSRSEAIPSTVNGRK